MTAFYGNTTNLQEIKLLAKSLLYMEPELTEYSPVVIHHPFTTSGIVGLKDAEGKLRLGNIVENEEDRKQWHRQMQGIIDGCGSALRVYSLIEKQYALGFLKHAAPSLSRADYSVILADAWIRSENPNNDPNLSRGKLLSMFKAADQTVLMNADERARLDELGETVTVYRGVRSSRPGSVKALSWTLDREIAQWFAERYGRNGTVYEAKIEKKHIHALFLGRNESEVILNPEYLTDITHMHSMAQGEMKIEPSPEIGGM